MEYTKGEWKAKQMPYGDYELTSKVADENVCVACVYLVPIASADGETSLGSAEANAHLIAAAPAMYEALEEAMRFIPKLSKVVLKGNQALALARGEQ